MNIMNVTIGTYKSMTKLYLSHLQPMKSAMCIYRQSSLISGLDVNQQRRRLIQVLITRSPLSKSN